VEGLDALSHQTVGAPTASGVRDCYTATTELFHAACAAARTAAGILAAIIHCAGSGTISC
jgi:hypothetical protein